MTQSQFKSSQVPPPTHSQVRQCTCLVQKQLRDSQSLMFESSKLIFRKKIKWIDWWQPVKEHPTVLVLTRWFLIIILQKIMGNDWVTRLSLILKLFLAQHFSRPIPLLSKSLDILRTLAYEKSEDWTEGKAVWLCTDSSSPVERFINCQCWDFQCKSFRVRWQAAWWRTVSSRAVARTRWTGRAPVRGGTTLLRKENLSRYETERVKGTKTKTKRGEKYKQEEPGDKTIM